MQQRLIETTKQNWVIYACCGSSRSHLVVMDSDATQRSFPSSAVGRRQWDRSACLSVQASRLQQGSSRISRVAQRLCVCFRRESSDTSIVTQMGTMVIYSSSHGGVWGDFLRLFWTLTTQKWKSSKRKLGLFTFQSKWEDCFALAVVEKQQWIWESHREWWRQATYLPQVCCILARNKAGVYGGEESDFRALSFVSSPIALKE